MFKSAIFLIGFILLIPTVPAFATDVYNCTIQQYFDLRVDMKLGITKADSARLVKYGKWLLQNKDKQGTPEFSTVLRAYRELDVQASSVTTYVDGPLIRGIPSGKAKEGTEEFIANFYAERMVGQKFKVDTGDGLITGFDPLNNDLAEKRHIILNGGAGQSFILLSIWGPIVASRYMEIKTFAVSDDKPFVVIGDGNVFSGKCN